MVLLEPMEPPFDPSPRPPGTSEPQAAETRFQLNRDNLTLADLLSRASEAWSRDLATWVLAMLLYWLLGIGVPMALGVVWAIISGFQTGGADSSAMFTAVDVVVQVAMQLVQLVLTAIFTLGLWAMAIRGVLGKRVTVGVLFSQLSKIWKYILQSLAISLGAILVILPIVVIIFLMFIGPVDLNTPMSEIMDDAGAPMGIALLVLMPLYVYLATGIAFIQAELAYDDDAGPITAIVSSWQIARGRRWRIIGVGLIAGLIAGGSFLLCGIGLLFGGPFAFLLFAALYLALRNGAGIPVGNTATTLGRDY